MKYVSTAVSSDILFICFPAISCFLACGLLCYALCMHTYFILTVILSCILKF
jgi:hypothetical protein